MIEEETDDDDGVDVDVDEGDEEEKSWVIILFFCLSLSLTLLLYETYVPYLRVMLLCVYVFFCFVESCIQIYVTRDVFF